MTISTGQDRDRVHPSPVLPAPGARPRRNMLVGGILVFGALSLIAAFTLTVLDAEFNHDHLAIYAAATFVLAGLSGAMLCLHCMLADRQQFYRRGHLEGWRQGWAGQPPEVDDPLLK